MRIEFRPLGPWTGPKTDPRRWGQFRASWTDTVDLLVYEAEKVDANMLVLQVDADPSDVRLDGMLRAKATVGYAGVKVSLDSRHGWLTYSTDTYFEWRDNVRAIALALQALRAVDRYGVSGAGEQYRGWAALPPGPSAQMSHDEAARLLSQHTHPPLAPNEILTDREVAALAFRRAARTAHPDAGGDRDLFERLCHARDVLAGAR